MEEEKEGDKRGRGESEGGVEDPFTSKKCINKKKPFKLSYKTYKSTVYILASFSAFSFFFFVLKIKPRCPDQSLLVALIKFNKNSIL